MTTLTKTTKTLKPADCDVKWYLVDADGVVLGRLASQIATILRGKNKPCYTPSQDCGDYVVVINAAKVKLTGKKMAEKMYYNYSGYLGGLKETTIKEMFEKHPEEVLFRAVKRMISRNPLGEKQMTKLRVFAGAEHTHQAQNPTLLDIASKNPKNKRGA